MVPCCNKSRCRNCSEAFRGKVSIVLILIREKFLFDSCSQRNVATLTFWTVQGINRFSFWTGCCCRSRVTCWGQTGGRILLSFPGKCIAGWKSYLQNHYFILVISLLLHSVALISKRILFGQIAPVYFQWRLLWLLHSFHVVLLVVDF